MNYCEECGSNIDSNMSFCPKCGKELSNKQVVTPTKKEPPKPTIKSYLISLGGFVVIALSLLLIFSDWCNKLHIPSIIENYASMIPFILIAISYGINLFLSFKYFKNIFFKITAIILILMGITVFIAVIVFFVHVIQFINDF